MSKAEEHFEKTTFWHRDHANRLMHEHNVIRYGDLRAEESREAGYSVGFEDGFNEGIRAAKYYE